MAGARGDIAKLQNLYANYDARRKFYFITAPQAGQGESGHEKQV